MKTKLLIGIIFMLLIACSKDNTSRKTSLNHVNSFTTEPRPFSIAIDNNKGLVYIANNSTSTENYSSKVQIFNLNGELLETFIDFESFNSGKYPRYSPNDICIDNDHVYILVKPMEQYNDTWLTMSGFCILQLDSTGSLLKEYDFSYNNSNHDQYSIAYLNDYLYVANGWVIIKIDKNSGATENIPVITDNREPYLLVSDFEIESEDNIYLTGQSPFRPDSVNHDISICHITRINSVIEQKYTFYSNSRTQMMASMLNNPGLVIGKNGYVYVATFYGGSLEVYDTENELVLMKKIKTPDNKETFPIDVALNEKDIYVLDFQNSLALIYN